MIYISWLINFLLLHGDFIVYIFSNIWMSFWIPNCVPPNLDFRVEIKSFGTLGQLIHILEPQYKCLQKVIYILLDGDDRMLDMSFEPHIMKIISHVHMSWI